MSNPTVFLSAATADLGEWRNILAVAFRRANCHVYVQETLGAPAGSVPDHLRRHLHSSDFVIHLAGMVYGGEPDIQHPPFPEFPEFQCSYTQYEYYYAHQLGKRVISFVCAEDFPYKTGFVEKGDTPEVRARRTQLQQAHRQRVSSGRFTNTPWEQAQPERPASARLSDVSDLLQAVAASLGTIQMDAEDQLNAVKTELNDLAQKRQEDLLQYLNQNQKLLEKLLQKFDTFAEEVADAVVARIHPGDTTTRAHAPTAPAIQQALNALLDQVIHSPSDNFDFTLSDQQRELIRAHHPRTLDEYRLQCVSEWSRTYYSVDSTFVSLTLMLDKGKEERFQPAGGLHRSLAEVLAADTSRAMVVLAAPGHGKSTLLRRHLLTLALDALREPDDDTRARMPFACYLQLRDYRRQGEMPLPPPLTWLEQNWGKFNDGLGAFTDLLRNTPMVLLLDGLNEMPHADFAAYNERIDAWHGFLRDLPGKAHLETRVVFSCREINWSSRLSSASVPVPHIRINTLDDEQVEQFLKHYAGDEDLGAAVYRKLENDPRRDLYTSPYYLRMLAEQAEDIAKDPAQKLTGRASLFTRFVRKVLARELQKHGGPLFRHSALLDDDERQSAENGIFAAGDHALPGRKLFAPLAHLAFSTQQQQRADGKDAQLTFALEKAPALLGGEAVGPVMSLVKAAEALQILKYELGATDASFTHQLFHEYFAARHVASLTAAPVPLAHAPWHASDITPPLKDTLAALAPAEPLPPLPATGWENSFPIAAAMMPARRAEAFVRALMAENLPLAGRCAAQPDVNVSETLRNDLRTALAARSHDRKADLRARIDAGHALGELGDTLRFAYKVGKHGGYRLPPTVAIPGGHYTIGSEGHDDYERPVHKVRIKPFELGQFPVTNAEYRCFIEAGGYTTPEWWATPAARQWQSGATTADAPRRWWKDDIKRFREDPSFQKLIKERFPDQLENFQRLTEMTASQLDAQLAEWHPSDVPPRFPSEWHNPAFNQPAQPVVGVSWYEARAYCAWLSTQTGNIWCLPSEAQWEAAARGLEGREYTWRGEFDASNCNWRESQVRSTTPIGVFPGGDTPISGKTPRVLSDMIGNVWEWTSSRYLDYEYVADDHHENPELDGPRVLRGGSWDSNRDLCRCAVRSGGGPGSRVDGIGFRLCLAPPIS